MKIPDLKDLGSLKTPEERIADLEALCLKHGEQWALVHKALGKRRGEGAIAGAVRDVCMQADGVESLVDRLKARVHALELAGEAQDRCVARALAEVIAALEGAPGGPQGYW